MPDRRAVPRPVTLLVVLLVIPGAGAVINDQWIWSLFGDGEYLAVDSVGIVVHDVWMSYYGIAIAPALVAFGVLLWRNTYWAAAVLWATATAVLTYAYLIGGFLVYAWITDLDMS
jgi:hypothetical protein